MADNEILQENEINTSILTSLFKRAFFKTDTDSEGDLLVKTDTANVIVMVNEELKLIKLMCVYGFQENVSEINMLRFLNKMNNEVVLVRFSSPQNRQDILLAEYYLPFESGIDSFHIINTLRFFSRIVPQIIHDYDTENLVA